MSYEIMNNGFVHRCTPPGPGSVAATPRLAVSPSGEVLCSFMLQSGLGMNDFVPHIARSKDAGETWTGQGPIWPHLRGRYSINTSISRSAAGDFFLFGFRMPITRPGESFWCQETLGILPNDLVWSRSRDEGRTWLDPRPFPVPLPGAAETPAPLQVLPSGRWVAPYSPHNTFDPDLKVDLQHVVLVLSDDEGAAWRHTSAIRVREKNSYVAEAWVTPLSDGKLLATTWHLHRGEGNDYPNAYALSTDDGQTWGPTRSTSILGQSAALAPLPGGRVLFVYNQRRHGKPGVWLAVVKPTEEEFGLLANDIIWDAAVATQHGSSGKSSSWTDFAFGEPAVAGLPDGTVLAVFWCIQPDGTGIRFVKLKIT